MLLPFGKRKKGACDMSMAKELEAAQATIEEQAGRVEALESENKALSDRVEELDGQADADKAEARAEGEKAAFAQVSERAEKYGAEFALEHLGASDAECQSAYIEKLESEKAALEAERDESEAGLKTGATAGDEGTKGKTFDARRRELMADGMSARNAAKQARREFAEKK